MEPRCGTTEFAGHRIAYRVAGQGPALVFVKQYRHPRNSLQLRLLADRYKVIQIEPLGFGDSDRPNDYPPAGPHEQVRAVLDGEAVDRFVVWGYSQGGAMAAAVAQATTRAAAMVAGGYSLVDGPTDAWMARMDRERRVPVAPRAFWHWFKRFDWREELARMSCPRLLYVGADDRTHAPGVRRVRDFVAECGVAVVEFDGLDHRTCEGEPAISTQVVPAVVDWLDRTLGTCW